MPIPLLAYGENLVLGDALRRELGRGATLIPPCHNTVARPVDTGLRQLVGASGGLDQSLPARVAAVTGKQLEAEMLSELDTGSHIWIAGELHGVDFCVTIQGRARVDACQPAEQGCFRIVLTLEAGHAL